MNVIDVTAINHKEPHVLVMDGLVQLFAGPVSEARERFPQAFSDSRAESSPTSEPQPPESLLAVASAFALGSAL